jgi:hypothetical protein
MSMSSERIYSASALACIADFRLGELRQWIEHGFPAHTDTREASGHFSIAEIGVARAISILTSIGLSTSTAVSASMKLLPIFENIFAAQPAELDVAITNILAVFPSGEMRLCAYSRRIVEDSSEGICVLVDALVIAKQVHDRESWLDLPRLMTARQLETMANAAMVSAWEPPPGLVAERGAWNGS